MTVARSKTGTGREGRVIPGISLMMGGREWTVPPLTLGQLRHLMPKIRQLSDIGPQMGEPQIDVLVEIVAAALQRNYPDMTIQMVENLLDLGNAAPVLQAVLTGSGLRSGGPSSGELKAPGSASGASAATPATTGDASTAFSPPRADTAIR
jgi:hypothetical protein